MKKIYNGDKEIKIDGNHQYFVRETGEEWQEVDLSVTGITNVLTPAESLMWWAVGQSQDYLEENMQDFVNEYVYLENDNTFSVDEVALSEFANEVRKAHQQYSGRATRVGSIVHKWIEKFLQGKDPAKPNNQQAAKGVESFLQWYEVHNIEVHATERMLYHDRYDYAGTVDLIAEIDGALCVVDFKTSNSIYPSHVFQTAGYQMAIEHEDGVEIDQRHLIHIDKEDGTFQPRDAFTKHKRDKSGFMNCLRLTRRKRRVEKEI